MNKKLKYLCEILSDVLNTSTNNDEIFEVMEILDKHASSGAWKKFGGNRRKLVAELKKVLKAFNLPPLTGRNL